MIRCPKKRRLDGLEEFIPVVADVGFGTQWRFAAESDVGALPDHTARWDNKRRVALHSAIAAVGPDDSASDIGRQIRGEEDAGPTTSSGWPVRSPTQVMRVLARKVSV
jgi:hypothetical protein